MSSGDPEETFLRVQLDLVAVEAVEGLPKIVDERGAVAGLDDDVIDVDLDVFADLLVKASLHAALVGGASVLQTEGHDVVAVDACWRDECSELLVFDFELDLVVTRVCVEKRKESAARSGVDDLVDAQIGRASCRERVCQYV